MNLDNLLNDTLDEFLLQCVSDKIEELSELPKMIKDIGYLENKQEFIEKTTQCEIFDTDQWAVKNYSVSGSEIHIQYEIIFILQTFINSEFIWRVTGSAQAEFSILDADSVDWSVFDEGNNNFWENYKKYKDLVHFQNIVYDQVECDTLYL